jgi:uncharacterized protein (TIGR00369 family)
MTAFAPANRISRHGTRESFARQGVMAFLGATLERVEPGIVEIALPFKPELSQQHGFFHGGVISTIADSAGGYAGFTLFPAEAGVLTVEFKINLLAAADGERAIAVGRVVRSGRTLTVCTLDAYVEKGGRRTHCATGMQTADGARRAIRRAGLTPPVPQDFLGIVRDSRRSTGPGKGLVATDAWLARFAEQSRVAAARRWRSARARASSPLPRRSAYAHLASRARGARGSGRARQLERLPAFPRPRPRAFDARGLLLRLFAGGVDIAPSSSMRSRRPSCGAASTARPTAGSRAPASSSFAASA